MEQTKSTTVKELHFTNTTISFTLPPSVLVRYDKVFESKEALWIQDNCSIFEKSSADKDSHSSVSDMMKNLYSLLLILTPIKKVHAKEVKCGRRILPRNTSGGLKEQTFLQWLIICCRVYFLSFSFTHESAEIEEHFREIHN